MSRRGPYNGELIEQLLRRLRRATLSAHSDEIVRLWLDGHDHWLTAVDASLLADELGAVAELALAGERLGLGDAVEVPLVAVERPEKLE